MKLKHLLYIAILGASFSACSSEVEVNDEAAEKATVNINLSQGGLTGTVDSRATDQMPLENANLMYNLILLHYNSNQVLTEVKYTSLNNNGLFETTWAPSLIAGDDDYVVLLANVKQDGDLLDTKEGWSDLQADRFANLRDVMTTALPLTSGSDGSYSSTKKMFMMGYYHGKVADRMNLNVMMGRMASCMKLVITPNYDCTISQVDIKNAVLNTHFFPATSTTGLSYGTYTDTPNATASSSTPLTLYYYTGENINPSGEQYTTAKITTVSTGSTIVDTKYANDDTNLDGYTLVEDVNDPNYKTGYLLTEDFTDAVWGGYTYTTKKGFYLHRFSYQPIIHTYIQYANSTPRNFKLADDTSDSHYFVGYYFSGNYYKHRYVKYSTNTKTYTVVLGSESPSGSNHSLYRNNTYTFNINLNN